MLVGTQYWKKGKVDKIGVSMQDKQYISSTFIWLIGKKKRTETKKALLLVENLRAMWLPGSLEFSI